MKYKFLIVGDSWGIGEWKKEFVIGEKPEDEGYGYGEWRKSWRRDDEWCKTSVIKYTDVGTHLVNLGHIVRNIAVGGDANIRQANLCKQALAKTTKHSKYDYVIWFHSEPIRDYLLNLVEIPNNLIDSLKEYHGYDNLLEYWFRETYQHYEEIYQQYDVPFFVIGGMTPLHPCINEFNFVKHKIVNWSREYIFDNSPEHPYNAGQFHRFVDMHLDILNQKRVEEEFNISEAWLKYCAMHKHFPDWGHPDNECHLKLADIIINQLK